MADRLQRTLLADHGTSPVVKALYIRKLHELAVLLDGQPEPEVKWCTAQAGRQETSSSGTLGCAADHTC